MNKSNDNNVYVSLALVHCVDVEPCQPSFFRLLWENVCWAAEKTVLVNSFCALKAIRSSADRMECCFTLFRSANIFEFILLLVGLMQTKELNEELKRESIMCN